MERNLLLVSSERASKEFSDPGITQLNMTTNVSESSFLTFLAALENKDYSITPQNVYEVQYLADNWKVTYLVEAIKQFLEESPELGLNLYLYLFNKKHKIDNKSVIPKIQKNIDYYYKFTALSELPLEDLTVILSKIDFTHSDHSQFFHFIMKLYQKDDKASILLKFIKPELLKSGELIYYKKIVGSYPQTKPSILKGALTIKEVIALNEERIKKLKEQLEPDEKEEIQESSIIDREEEKANQLLQELEEKVNSMPDLEKFEKLLAKVGHDIAQYSSTISEDGDGIQTIQSSVDDIEYTLYQLHEAIERQMPQT